jgi:pyruvate dehydrogenase E2 component (dihydrolipoamide acetyltransferase)
VSIRTVNVPDLGSDDAVEVIEVCVQVGDVVEVEQSLLVLESDKASIEVPSPVAGKITAIHAAEGDELKTGSLVCDIEVAGDVEESAEAASEEEKAEEVPAEPTQEVSAPEVKAQASEPTQQTALLPDIGDDAAEVIEILVSAGDQVSEGDTLLVLESDKASMEVPSPYSGTVMSLHCNLGDELASGAKICEMQVNGVAESVPAVDEHTKVDDTIMQAQESASADPEPVQELSRVSTAAPVSPAAQVYAGPAVRKLAREFGIDLAKVHGSGPKNRILKEDLHAYVQKALSEEKTGGVSSGTGIPPIPAVDFASFGEIDMQPLSRLDKVTAANMSRSWLNVPHVTQFDDANITELEAFRATLKPEMERKGVKLSPLPFLMKAVAVALQRHPKLGGSLHSDGEHYVYKKYIHIGMAVDTPAGLVVPVIRDVDKKTVWEIGAEVLELAAKAKARKLKPADMQGGCFTISSLGNIGGTGFTPIVNAPEVAILGVSRASMKPVYKDGEFVPAKMLPLSLSYDHRAINGGDAGRFMTELCALLADIRLQLL